MLQGKGIFRGGYFDAGVAELRYKSSAMRRRTWRWLLLRRTLRNNTLLARLKALSMAERQSRAMDVTTTVPIRLVLSST